MPTLVADCPRCKAHEHTFDVPCQVVLKETGHADWMEHREVFAICRRCSLPSIFHLELYRYEGRDHIRNDAYWTSASNLNAFYRVVRYVSLRDNLSRKAPEFVPPGIESAFEEGAICLSVGCYNAAATMFRLCLDIATRDLLPPLPIEGEAVSAEQPSKKHRRDLGLRIPWLIENGRLPEGLRGLADVVREDANDGAHAGTLGKEDAEDIADFTEVLLDRLFTEPGKIEEAKRRRIDRRGGHSEAAAG